MLIIFLTEHFVQGNSSMITTNQKKTTYIITGNSICTHKDKQVQTQVATSKTLMVTSTAYALSPH
jgi:hypothetical protein